MGFLLRIATIVDRRGAGPEKVPALLRLVGENLRRYRWQGRLKSHDKVLGAYSLSAMPAVVDLERHVKQRGPDGQFLLTGRFEVPTHEPKKLDEIQALLASVASRLSSGEARGLLLDPFQRVVGSYEMNL